MESTECRLTATNMIAAAEKEGYKGEWAIEALAGCVLEGAAALWAIRETIGPAMDRLANPEEGSAGELRRSLRQA